MKDLPIPTSSALLSICAQKNRDTTFFALSGDGATLALLGGALLVGTKQRLCRDHAPGLDFWGGRGPGRETAHSKRGAPENATLQGSIFKNVAPA